MHYEEALYQVYGPLALPLPLLQHHETAINVIHAVAYGVASMCAITRLTVLRAVIVGDADAADVHRSTEIHRPPRLYSCICARTSRQVVVDSKRGDSAPESTVL